MASRRFASRGLPPPAAGMDLSVFPASYADARQHFLAAARRAGLPVESWPHPLAGPEGEALAIDTCRVGPPDAARVLVVQSALHGVEGFAGSAVQADLLALLSADQLPPGVALLLVHAVNPWGFAWQRRTNEAGVDLNRNAVDFSEPPPANAGYDELADALVPASDDPAALAAADAKLGAWRAAHGQEAFDLAVTAGQYRHPEGLFYGGSVTSWSLERLRDIVGLYALTECERVAIVDVHTGLGPYGHGEVICDHPPGSEGVRIARRFYGKSVTEPLLGTSSSLPKHGLVDFFWHRTLPDRCCFVTLEFGTYPLPLMFPVLRDDHMLHARGIVDWQDEKTRRIKSALRDHFYPAFPDWQQMVLFRSRQIVLQALAGLAIP